MAPVAEYITYRSEGVPLRSITIVHCPPFCFVFLRAAHAQNRELCFGWGLYAAKGKHSDTLCSMFVHMEGEGGHTCFV